MFEEFDNFITEFAVEDFHIDYWYDEGVDIAEKMICKFDDNDWQKLVEAIPKKNTEWCKRLAYCLNDSNNAKQLMVLLNLVEIDDDELFEIVVDSMRGFTSEESIGLIQGNLHIITKMEELMPRAGVATKKIFEAFLKQQADNHYDAEGLRHEMEENGKPVQSVEHFLYVNERRFKRRGIMQEIQKNTEDEKALRTIGKWLLLIAGIILCINVLCRVADAVKSTQCVRADGTVTAIQTTKEWVRAGGQSFEVPTYTVWIKYPIEGYNYFEEISEKYRYSSHTLSKGDTVPVLYQKNAKRKAYVAKKDWLTGAYLPINKNYNAPFVIAIVLFVLGILFYTNSPILEWFVHTGEIKVGKKK